MNDTVNCITDLNSDLNCCGCGACVDVCPTRALTMTINDEGFWFPTCDNSKCIKCKKCISICSFKNVSQKLQAHKPLCYAAYHKDERVLGSSSSGGMFTAISDVFLNNNGAIVASVYDYETNSIQYRLIQNKSVRDSAKGSKYIQSDYAGIFKIAHEWLNREINRELVVFGTPCFCDGFRSYMSLYNLNQRVYTIDLICHGVGSPAFFSCFLKYVESKVGKITYLSFKDKRNGWLKPYSVARGETKEIGINAYTRIYNDGYILRKSCYCCPYTTIYKSSDLTIGDFWGIRKVDDALYNDQGTSIVLIHSNRGKGIFDKISDDIVFEKTSLDKSLQLNLVQPTRAPKKREFFWKMYYIIGVRFVIFFFGSIPNKLRRIKNNVLSIIRD